MNHRGKWDSRAAAVDPLAGWRGVEVLHDRADGRAAMVGARVEGAWVATRGRAVRDGWRLRPEREVERVAACGQSWRWSRADADGSLSAHPARCRSPRCESCQGARAAREGEELAAEVEAMRAAGAQVLVLTLTRRPGVAPPPRPLVLTRAEVAAGWRAPPGWRIARAGEVGVASVGESFGDALEALRSAWRALRHDGAGARWWRRTVAGYLYRWEVTGSARSRPGRPRYHVHLHAVVVLRGGVDPGEVTRDGRGRVLSGGWAAQVVDRWCAAVAAGGGRAHRNGQRATPIVDGQGGADAVRYAVKYPYKAAALTTAQHLEVAAGAVGLHRGARGGGLHGRSRAHRDAERVAAMVSELRPAATTPAWERAAVLLERREQRAAARRRLLLRPLRSGETRPDDARVAWSVMPDGPSGFGSPRPWVAAECAWASEVTAEGARWVATRADEGGAVVRFVASGGLPAAVQAAREAADRREQRRESPG